MEPKAFDKSIKRAPTNFFSISDFSNFQSSDLNMIGVIGFAVCRKEFWKKSIHVTREIFMKKSFVYFREHI